MRETRETRGLTIEEVYYLIHGDISKVKINDENMSQLYSLTKNLMEFFEIKN